MAVYTTIDDPSAHFKVQLYAGTGSSQSITFNDTDTNMQPDLVWIKNRDDADNHGVFDSVRGTQKHLKADTNDPEATRTDALSAFDSDGFSFNGSNAVVNTSSEDYVAWCWKGGGSASANSVGSIDSSVSANTTSGFGIATYTGSGSADTVGHGIGIVPQVVFAKRRDSSSHWMTYHHSLGNANELYLNQTSATSSAANTWNSTTPTTTVSSVKNDANNTSTGTFVNYLFAPVQGFSKFGTYKGTGSAANLGPFIYLGFRPALVITKPKTEADAWSLWDNKRPGYNNLQHQLFAHASSAESAGASTKSITFCANGFKIDGSDAGELNNSGDTFVYLAWAEAPFVNSEGVPCNAR